MRTRNLWPALVLAAVIASPTLAGFGAQPDEPQFAPVPDYGASRLPPCPVDVGTRRPASARFDARTLDVPCLRSLRPDMVRSGQRPAMGSQRPIAVRPVVRVRVAAVHQQPVAPGVHRLAGLASWFCRYGVSICTAGYPPGSMVAAACGRLRTAMGAHWRGRVVTVRSGSRSVEVTLVDWCGSTSKTIDVYYAVMVRLGGTGVLPVVVLW